VEPHCVTTLPGLETAAPQHEVRCRRWQELHLGEEAST